jgi:flagellar hook-associated protein 2
MAFGVSGIVSGMDTGAMVDAMVGVYSLPQKALEQDIQNAERKKQAVSGVMKRLDALDSAIEDIEDEDDFKVYKADYEETDAFTVTAESGAIPGNYSIQVNTLATTELEVSQGFADKSSNAVIAKGTLTVTYGGTDSEIEVEASTSSLTKLAEMIDDIDGLSAYVLDTGSSSDPYKLVVQGEDTGADNTIEFDTSGLAGAGTVPSFTEQRTAGDAEVEINGITVSDSDNNFSSAIPGLDIEILQTTTSSENVTVSLDADKIESNVQSIVDAYNDVVNYVHQNQVFNSDLGIKGPLVGETTVQRVLRRMQTIVSSEYSVGDEINSLSLMGIKTSSDGTLAITSSDFGDSLETYLDDVVAMFTEDDGFSSDMRDQVDTYTDSVDGTLESMKDSLEGRIMDLKDSVAEYDYRINRYESRLRAQFASMEQLLGGMQGTSNYMAAYLNGNSD